ncbi:MAG: hypothetical protein ACJ8G1_19020 [Vitreoscilla sp.]
MSYFRVQLHGKGIILSGSSADRPLVGFYTTRVVKASSTADAVDVASQSVLAQWAGDGSYVHSNRGSIPQLSVEWIRHDTFLSALFFRATGYCFYWDDDDGEEAG